MKRTFLTALSSLAVALAVPSMAAAAHHGRSHHRAHHAKARHHSHHKAAAVSGAVSTTSAPVAAGQPAIVPHSEATSTSPGTTPPAPAGTVTSFTGGVLTITLTGGGTQTGQVTEETGIECVSATAPTGTEGEQDDQSGQSSSGGGSSQHDAVHKLGTSSTGEEQGQDDSQDSPEESKDSQEEGQDSQDSQDGPTGTPCTTAALTPAAVVRVAELNVTSTGAVWDRIVIVQ